MDQVSEADGTENYFIIIFVVLCYNITSVFFVKMISCFLCEDDFTSDFL